MQHLVPYTPQQNGVAENKNRALKEMATFSLEAKIFDRSYQKTFIERSVQFKEDPM